MTDFRLIDYDHTQDGALCNGFVSNLDGRSEVIWTYDLHGGSVAQTRPVPETVFTELWDGINASLARRGVFWRNLVTDPTLLIDPDAGHVIVAMSEQDGAQRWLTFLIPANETDPEFMAWLEALAVPVAAPPTMAA